MALSYSSSRTLCSAANRTAFSPISNRHSLRKPSSESWSHIFTVSANPKKRRSGSITTKEQQSEKIENIAGVEVNTTSVDDGFVIPELPGDKPNFWEGQQWDSLGFFVEYLWAFGIVFALIACGIAVATYNEGATDFKETPAYKESIQSRELLEEPEASNSEVFEANPTEQAPDLK